MAGERRLRTAIAFASHQFTYIAGFFGVVMGARNLKYLVVRGAMKSFLAALDRPKVARRQQPV